jgi:hypothetical protein
MDLKHFGDAYDVVKRSLLQWLEPFGPWAAHPMFTHPVTPDQAAAFARMLRVPLVSTEILAPDTDRRSYLSVGTSARSVFLDPDTGIRLHRRERHRSTEFVFADELVAIAADRPNGLVLVFDQSVPRGSERKSVETKLQLLGGQGLAGFGYVSQACFLVLGTSTELVMEAHACVIAASDLPATRLTASTQPNMGLRPAVAGVGC